MTQELKPGKLYKVSDYWSTPKLGMLLRVEIIGEHIVNLHFLFEERKVSLAVIVKDYPKNRFKDLIFLSEIIEDEDAST